YPHVAPATQRARGDPRGRRDVSGSVEQQQPGPISYRQQVAVGGVVDLEHIVAGPASIQVFPESLNSPGVIVVIEHQLSRRHLQRASRPVLGEPRAKLSPGLKASALAND